MKVIYRRALGMMVVGMTLSAASPAPELAIGDRLPLLQGEYLNGQRANLPQDSSGRVALLLLGFTYESRFAVEAWAKRFRQDFGEQPKVTFFEIPMIGGLAGMGKWFIDGGMRRGTPKTDYGNVITVYGGTDAWKQRVGVKDPKAAYLILIDGDGKVAWRYAGGFADEPYAALSSNVSRLLSGR
jgi:hypothetical protein